MTAPNTGSVIVNEFLQNVCKPRVAVFCSADADLIIRKNNLTFAELLQPFSHVELGGTIKDVFNHPHHIQSLSLEFLDISWKPKDASSMKKILGDVVASCSPGQTTQLICGKYALEVDLNTPWYDCWRHTFLMLQHPGEYDFVKHAIACFIVVSSSHNNPIEQFKTMSGDLNRFQHDTSRCHIKWLLPTVLKYYIFVHDVSDGNLEKARIAFDKVSEQFGSAFCHMLHMNSKQQADEEESYSLTDLWSGFINQQAVFENPVAVEDPSITPGEASALPSHVQEGTSESPAGFHTPSSGLLTPVLSNMESSVSAPELAFDVTDGLGMPQSVIFHPLSPDAEARPEFYISKEDNEEDSGLQMPINPEVWGALSTAAPKKHGVCLTPSDLDRIRTFLYEFCMRALFPFVERQIRALYDSVGNRKGIHRSFITATKKWFAGGKPGVSQHGSTSVFYNPEACELQLRRLGDLALQFRLYALAYQFLHAAKRDFNADQAWAYFAGASEMAALAMFLQGQKQFPQRYFDTAINVYLNVCMHPELATRTAILSTECLKSVGEYGEAAKICLKLTHEDSDLRSAVMLEQASLCFLLSSPPMPRKYGIHMILAGHRYGKAGLRKHALRSYQHAFQTYMGKGWKMAEDHIHTTVGRHANLIGDTELAEAAFRELLSEYSCQTPVAQTGFLRDYLGAFQAELDDGKEGGKLLEFPLPILKDLETVVLLSPSVTIEDAINSLPSLLPEWKNLEESAIMEGQGSLPVTPVFRPSYSFCSQFTDNTAKPKVYIGETLRVQSTLINPFGIPLNLLQVCLLWIFVQRDGTEKSNISKQYLIACSQNSTSVETQVLESLTLEPSSTTKLELSLKIWEEGELQIIGMAYHLQGPSVDACGMKSFKVHGPRLNNTKQEKCGRVYGIDNRLNLVVHSPMPVLQVEVQNLQSRVLCGEVQKACLLVKNLGSCPLTGLRVATSWKHRILFTCQEIEQEEETNKGDPPSVCISEATMMNNLQDPFVTVIKLPRLFLDSGEEHMTPIWVCAPEKVGLYDIPLVFYYEEYHPTLPEEAGGGSLLCPRYRILHHVIRVETMNSLGLVAAVQRSPRVLTEDADQVAEKFQLSLECQNLNEVQDESILELTLDQMVTCSPSLLISGFQTPYSFILRAKERLHFFIYLHKKMEDINGSSHTISQVTLTEKKGSSSIPCMELFELERAILKAKAALAEEEERMTSAPGTKLEDCRPIEEVVSTCIDLLVIFLWKCNVVEEDGKMRIAHGLHMIHLDSLDIPISTSDLGAPLSDRPPLTFGKVHLSLSPGSACSSGLSEHLVKCTFKHQAFVSHDFKQTRICIIPAEVVIHNCVAYSVMVSLDTRRPSNKPSHAKRYHPRVSLPFTWVGATVLQLSLGPLESKTVNLLASFTRPGVYNVASLMLACSWSQYDSLHAQVQPCESILTLSQT